MYLQLFTHKKEEKKERVSFTCWFQRGIRKIYLTNTYFDPSPEHEHSSADEKLLAKVQQQI